MSPLRLSGTPAEAEFAHYLVDQVSAWVEDRCTPTLEKMPRSQTYLAEIDAYHDMPRERGMAADDSVLLLLVSPNASAPPTPPLSPPRPTTSTAVPYANARAGTPKDPRSAGSYHNRETSPIDIPY